MYLWFYLLFICVYVLLCLLLHALHAGSFPLSEISIRALGLTPGLDHPSFHPQVYHRVESQVQDRGRSAWVVDARVTLELTGDICCIYFDVGHVIFIRICIDF